MESDGLIIEKRNIQNDSLFFWHEYQNIFIFVLQFNGELMFFCESYIRIGLFRGFKFFFPTLSVNCSWICPKMGNLLGWTQQCNGKWRCICILISACDSSVIAAIMATVALLFSIAKWLNHWFILLPDCLSSTSSDQSADKVEPVKTPTFHI